MYHYLVLMCLDKINKNAFSLELEVRETENNNWIPISSGLFPDELEDVQVTFIGYNDHVPHCEAFAYRNDEGWHWSCDDSEVKVEITAWKKSCEPYKAE